MKARVIIYSRPGCHLCEEAQEAMRIANCEELYTLEEINIEDDPQLLHRYRYDIPVITIDGTEIFRHQLTAAEFKEALRRKDEGGRNEG